MDSWIYVLGISCLAVFVIGSIVSILYDLGILQEDPEAARRRKERQRMNAERLTITRENEKKRREEADQERQKEADRIAQEATKRRQESDGRAAREHLKEYYAAHKFIIADLYPPSLMEAFIRCSMPEGMNPDTLWAVCQSKIAELLAMVQRVRLREVRAEQIDAEIADCRAAIRNLEQQSKDKEWLADEKEEFLRKLQELELKKRLVMAKE